MSPNPLKVGDKPQFTVTYQNISDKPITHPLEHMCCLWMAYSISPTDKVQEKIFEEGTLNLMADGFKDLQPNQIVTDPGLGSSGPVDSSVRAWQSPSHAEYQITKPGMITVTMNMWMAVDSADLIDTIQFNVNATQ